MPTYTYDGSLENPKDVVRFLIGDVDDSDWLLADEEIAWILSQQSNPYLAGADAAMQIAGSLAREVSVSADGISINLGDAAQKFIDLADQLRKRGKRGRHGPPYVGGISHRERIKDDVDDDLIPTHFRSHMHDSPGTSHHRSENPLTRSDP